MRSTGDPASIWKTVTPHDVNNFTDGECNYIYIGTAAGNLVAICDGVAVTFVAPAAGYHPIRCTRINATGTGCSDIRAAYVKN